MFVIRKAKPEDLDSIRTILQQASLQEEGVEEYLEHFFIVEEPDLSLLVGVVGMEVYPPYGLLRSFVLEKQAWNLEVIWRLFQILFSYAKQLHLSRIYLIASSAVEWFQLLGFTVVEPEELPETILSSEHSQRTLEKGTAMVYCDLTSKKH